MGFIDVLANVARYLPTVKNPTKRPSLYRRLLLTGVVLTLYFVMANVPLYGVEVGEETGLGFYQIIFAANVGTLMELGIGPIVTASLVLQVLVGAKIINLDLSDPESRKKFTAAQKTLAILFGVFEATMFVVGCKYWAGGLAACEAGWLTRFAVVVQLTIATYMVILFDEMLQKGWGIGSAISLFILGGVAYHTFWALFGLSPVGGQHYGFIPYVIQNGISGALIREQGYPDLVGLIATMVAILVLVYLQGMRVEIPITSQRLRGMRSRVPLQFLYVTNIPILLVGILVADLGLFASAARSLAGEGMLADILQKIHDYTSPPRGLMEAASDVTRTAVYVVSWFVLAILFGYMWVEIAGLNPEAQVRNLIRSGLDVPGMRRNPKALERLLAKYIYPLTLLSSMIVAAIAVTADIFGAYGSGTGILLAVGIIIQYYRLIAYERALEAYPLLKRILGEE